MLEKGPHQLIEEENAGGGRPGLVENVSDVGLAFTKPHRQQLGTLDRDEVGLALVGDGLGQQRLTCKGQQQLNGFILNRN